MNDSTSADLMAALLTMHDAMGVFAQKTDAHFDAMDVRFHRFDRMDVRFDRLEGRVAALEPYGNRPAS